MRRLKFPAIAVLLLGGLAALPVSGEEIEYYVWTDEDGVIHAEDTPPKDRDYETRTIWVDEDAAPAPEIRPRSSGTTEDSDTGQRPATTGAESGNREVGIVEEERRRLEAEQQRLEEELERLQESNGSEAERRRLEEELRRVKEAQIEKTGGGARAPGADTAPSGSTATGGGTAAGGATGAGAATAPGASVAPPVPTPGP